jgi:hypothetical protein
VTISRSFGAPLASMRRRLPLPRAEDVSVPQFQRGRATASASVFRHRRHRRGNRETRELPVPTRRPIPSWQPPSRLRTSAPPIRNHRVPSRHRGRRSHPGRDERRALRKHKTRFRNAFGTRPM